MSMRDRKRKDVIEREIERERNERQKYIQRKIYKVKIWVKARVFLSFHAMTTYKIVTFVSRNLYISALEYFFLKLYF